MTEEMIVNGVDVSDCGFLDYHRPTKLLLCNECNSDFAAMECKDDPNCYYKQLKRLELENTKLKGSNESLIRRLSTKMLSDEHYDIRTLEAENLMLAEENKKLKQALEEIREITIYDNEVLKDE